jgi:type II secretory pathway component PulM
MKFTDSAKQFWDLRSAKERILLCAAGAVALAALFYVFLLEPALSARKQLSATLPRLRAQVEDMRQQQKEIAALRKKVAAASQHGDLKVLLQASIARSSFVNAVERIESLSGDKALLLAAPVMFDDWIGWTESLQREFGIRLEVCKITATDQPGLVRIEATFAQGGQPVARKTP